MARGSALLVASILAAGCGGKVDLGQTGATHDGGTTADTAPPATLDASDATEAKAPVADLRFRKIAAGSTRYCGITEPDARLVCVEGETIVTDRAGPYVDVSMSQELSWDYTCAVRASGELECSSTSVVLEPPQGTFTQVSVGFFNACAVASEGTIACWVPAGIGGIVPPAVQVIPTADPPFRGPTLSVNMWHGCALTSLFHLHCFGPDVVTPRMTAHYFALAVAPKNACAITFPDQEIWCWSATPDGADSGEKKLEGAYESVAVDLNGYGCGVTTGGEIRCFGQQDYAPPPDVAGPFQSIAIGGRRACALRVDGRVACWSSRTR